MEADTGGTAANNVLADRLESQLAVNLAADSGSVFIAVVETAVGPYGAAGLPPHFYGR